MRGPGIKLEGRERDRVLSEYLELLPSQDPAHRKLPGMKQLAVFLTLVSILPALAVFSLRFLFSDQGQLIPTLTTAIILVVLTVVIGSIVIAFGMGLIGPRRRLWWVAMRKCGHHVCALCGYSLEHRAPDSRACPECGTPDDEQPVPLGPRRFPNTWPRFEVESSPDSAERRDASDRP